MYRITHIAEKITFRDNIRTDKNIDRATKIHDCEYMEDEW